MVMFSYGFHGELQFIQLYCILSVHDWRQTVRSAWIQAECSRSKCSSIVFTIFRIISHNFVIFLRKFGKITKMLLGYFYDTIENCLDSKLDDKLKESKKKKKRFYLCIDCLMDKDNLMTLCIMAKNLYLVIDLHD